MKNLCPYDKKVICQYRESEIAYECEDCIHYRPHTLVARDPLDGAKTIGCLFVGVIFIIGAIALIAFIIHAVRPEIPPMP